MPDLNFWLSIGVGALLSVPLAIVANFCTEPLRRYFTRWRALRLSRKLSDELERHALAKDLRDGKEAAKARVEVQRFEALFNGILAITCVQFCCAFGAIAVYATVIGNTNVTYLTLGASMISVLLFTYTMMQALRYASKYTSTNIRVELFGSYEASIRQKWGDVI